MPTLAEIERDVILAALDEIGWQNKTAVANELGISLNTLYNRINAYGWTFEAAAKPVLPAIERPEPVWTTGPDVAEIEIPATLEVALVDRADLEFLSQFRWCVSVSEQLYRYAITGSGPNGQRWAMHRLVAGAKPGEIVDHLNGNTLDNRRANLRVCTAAENARNNWRRRARSAA